MRMQLAYQADATVGGTLGGLAVQLCGLAGWRAGGLAVRAGGLAVRASGLAYSCAGWRAGCAYGLAGWRCVRTGGLAVCTYRRAGSAYVLAGQRVQPVQAEAAGESERGSPATLDPDPHPLADTPVPISHSALTAYGGPVSVDRVPHGATSFKIPPLFLSTIVWFFLTPPPPQNKLSTKSRILSKSSTAVQRPTSIRNTRVIYLQISPLRPSSWPQSGFSLCLAHPQPNPQTFNSPNLHTPSLHQIQPHHVSHTNLTPSSTRLLSP